MQPHIDSCDAMAAARRTGTILRASSSPAFSQSPRQYTTSKLLKGETSTSMIFTGRYSRSCVARSRLVSTHCTAVRRLSSLVRTLYDSPQSPPPPPTVVRKTSIMDVVKIRRRGKRKITMVTAYDYPSAVHVCRAGIDMLLVGDSVGMVELGYDTTQPVTVNDMLHHCQVRKRKPIHCRIDC